MVRATGHAMQGTSCWQQGRIREAVAELDAGVALLAAVGPPGDALEGEQRMVTASFHLTCHAIHGDRTADEVRDGFVALAGLAPPLAVPSICGLAGSTAMSLGRFDHLAEHAEHALQADPSSQFAFWGGQLLMHRAVVAAEAGHLDEGREAFAEGEERYLRIGARTSLPNFQAAMAGRLAVRGDVDAAADLTTAARRNLGDEVWAEPQVLVAEAYVAHAVGDTSTAAARLATARRVATSQAAMGYARRAEAVAAELDVELPSELSTAAP